ncbi:MAG: glycerol-3-phosphate 1-O-acyltransferase PlsB [Xanthomonadales bacterium]|nr:glycerol-3-phosphate 1-O-acyltransferase PlsB [Xanthomonadales bacterium]
MAKRRKSRFSTARFFYPLLRWLVRRLVKQQVLPPDLEFDRSRPICYVLETDALSNILILQKTCHEHEEFPMPLDELPVAALPRMRSVISLQDLRGFFIRRPDLRRHLDQLSDMVDVVEAGKCSDLQLVPVSIFLGRAPDKETGLMRILFSENWPVAGRIRRMLSMLIHGRNTIVQFSKPISIAEQIEEGRGKARTVRKISRVLRVHFRRLRASVLGPDLSHRRTLVDEILRSPQVREAIKSSAKRNKQSIPKARRRARRYVEEIAADYYYQIVRLLERLLGWFWNKVYDGIKVNHLRNLLDIEEGAEIIYVPCHRSHIDYLIASYLVYRNGLVVPHIAAGINLNIPIVGSILRRAGAFFLRRSFKANQLYSAVFHEYVETIFAKGVSMEYFIEGTRSRTGRLLQPRTGMLAMTVRSFLRHSDRPTVFVPIYIGYERLAEGGSYLGELSGGSKKKETLGGLLRALGVVKEQFGQVQVSFGEPIDLAAHLDQCHKDWRETRPGPDEKPEWLAGCVDQLAYDILTRINEAAEVNPINLVALAILSSPKNAMAENDLLAQIGLYRKLIEALPYSELTTQTQMAPEEIIAYAEKLEVIKRQAHPLGDILRCGEREAFLLSYFRNNALHVTAVYSWCACVFINNTTFSRRELLRLGRVIYPFLKGELFLSWSTAEFLKQCERCVELFTELELLVATDNPDTLQRARGGSGEALALKMLGENVFTSLERYYMVIAILSQNGPGTLSTGELENLCHLTAQRLSMIYTLDTPDYFDKALFKLFIRKLKDRRIIDIDEDGRLTFTDLLPNIVEDAKVILSKEVRHSIMQLSADSNGQAATQKDAA